MNLPVPIDNEPILRRALRRAKECFRRAEQLEAAIERFEAIDLKRYGVWHRQTFGEILDEIERKRREFTQLADLHNHVVCLANLEAISMPRAYRLILDEDRRFANGDEAVRREIERARQQRLAWLNAAAGEGARDEGDDDADADAEFDAREDRTQREFDFEVAGQDEAAADRGTNADADADANANAGAGGADRVARGQTGDLFRFAEDATAAAREEDRRLRVKSLFRSIARRIHPDSIDSGLQKKTAAWLRRVWNQAVIAHARGDLAGLTAVHGEILLANRQLDGMNLADIRTVVTAVAQAYAQRQVAAKSIKQSPAWNFSKLKSTGKLKAKIERTYAQTLYEVDAQVEELRYVHQIWSNAGEKKAKRKSRAQARARKW